MTKAFRTGLTAVYVSALKGVGVAVDVDDITPHINSAATVILTDAQLETVRAAKLEGYAELSAHGNSGAIKIVVKAGIDYLLKNRPTLTDEERAAKRAGKGTGPSIGTKEEVAARRRAQDELNRKLEEAYGIKFGKPEEAAESDDDSDDADGEA
jgi:hypothetical protein